MPLPCTDGPRRRMRSPGLCVCGPLTWTAKPVYRPLAWANAKHVYIRRSLDLRQWTVSLGREIGRGLVERQERPDDGERMPELRKADGHRARARRAVGC